MSIDWLVWKPEEPAYINDVPVTEAVLNITFSTEATVILVPVHRYRESPRPVTISAVTVE